MDVKMGRLSSRFWESSGGSPGTCFVSVRSWFDIYLELFSVVVHSESPFSLESGFPEVEVHVWGPQCPV